MNTKQSNAYMKIKGMHQLLLVTRIYLSEVREQKKEHCMREVTLSGHHTAHSAVVIRKTKGTNFHYALIARCSSKYCFQSVSLTIS